VKKKRDQEMAEDRRAMLAAGQAEVGEEGDRLAGLGTVQPAYWKDTGFSWIWKKRIAGIPAVLPEPMAIGAEGTGEALAGDENLGISLVGLDAPGNPAYPLHQIPFEVEEAISLNTVGRFPDESDPHSANCGGQSS